MIRWAADAVGWKAMLRRRTLLLLAAALAIGLGTPRGVAAQGVSRADSAAVLLETARMFEEQGRTEVAEALYQLLRDSYGSTPAGVAAGERLGAIPGERLDRSGRVELQVWGTMYGLWLGIAVPTALGADNAEAFGAGLLSGGFAGLLAARAATRSRDLTEGQVRAVTWGGTWGTWQGLGWAEVLDLGEEEICTPDFCYTNGDETEEIFGSMILGGLTGIATGALIARNPVRLGTASGAHYGSLWGTWIGAASTDIFDLDGDDGWTATLLAGNAGLIGGALASRALGMSRNRVRLVSLGGLLGGLTGAGLLLLINPDDLDGWLALPLGTSLAGLGVGVYATRDYDRPGGTPPGSPAMGAVLNHNDGRWWLDTPVPAPTWREFRYAGGRIERRLGLSISLFRAVF